MSFLKSCELGCSHEVCAYGRFFAPRAADGPSGLKQPPRPFIVRTRHLDGATVAPSSQFQLDIHLFPQASADVDALQSAVQILAASGIGPGRVPLTVEACNCEEMSVDFTAPAVAISRLHIDFLTPTEIKDKGSVLTEPELDILLMRARERLCNLQRLYAPEISPFPSTIVAARRVQSSIQHISASRHSTRTGQTHPLGGFVGYAEFEGDLTEAYPILNAAQWTGVGRQTVWGKGELRLTL